MKEKNIVDFTKMMKIHDDYYDENGDAVGCEICYTHQKAYEKLSGVNIETEIPKPVCPICGKPLSRRFNWTENGSDIVTEGSNMEYASVFKKGQKEFKGLVKQYKTQFLYFHYFSILCYFK